MNKMRAHLYQQRVYESPGDFQRKHSDTQNRLYFPGKGVIAYRGDRVDFFSDDQKIIEEARDIMGGKSKLEGAKYLGQVELPEDVVSMVVSAGKALNATREVFNASSEKLLKLL